MAFSRVPQARPWARDRKLRKRLLLSIQLIHDPGQDCTFPNLMHPGIQTLPRLQRGLWDNTISCRQNAGQCDIISHLATLLLLGDLPLRFEGPFLSRENQEYHQATQTEKLCTSFLPNIEGQKTRLYFSSSWTGQLNSLAGTAGSFLLNPKVQQERLWENHHRKASTAWAPLPVLWPCSWWLEYSLAAYVCPFGQQTARNTTISEEPNIPSLLSKDMVFPKQD